MLLDTRVDRGASARGARRFRPARPARHAGRAAERRRPLKRGGAVRTRRQTRGGEGDSRRLSRVGATGIRRGIGILARHPPLRRRAILVLRRQASRNAGGGIVDIVMNGGSVESSAPEREPWVAERSQSRSVRISGPCAARAGCHGGSRDGAAPRLAPRGSQSRVKDPKVQALDAAPAPDPEQPRRHEQGRNNRRGNVSDWNRRRCAGGTRDTETETVALARRPVADRGRRGEGAGDAVPAPAPEAPDRAPHDLLVPIPDVATLIERAVEARRSRVRAHGGDARGRAVRAVRRRRGRCAHRHEIGSRRFTLPRSACAILYAPPDINQNRARTPRHRRGVSAVAADGDTRRR